MHFPALKAQHNRPAAGLARGNLVGRNRRRSGCGRQRHALFGQQRRFLQDQLQLACGLAKIPYPFTQQGLPPGLQQGPRQQGPGACRQQADH